MKKRFVSALLCVLLALTAVAAASCGRTQSDPPSDDPAASADPASSLPESGEETQSEDLSAEEKSPDSSAQDVSEPPEATPDEYFTFTLLEDGTYEIAADKTKTMPEQLVLPSEHEGKPVTRIAAEAFTRISDFVTLVIPDSVVSIGERAFYYCSTPAFWEFDRPTFPRDYENMKGLVSVTMTDSVAEIG
ncbi:MAG: hypothetical protein J6X52_03260, partial [Clostridia bacterium]|nr:hypothetical protein [Clostridia bacterium]